MESDTTELPQRETVFPTAWSSGTMAPGSMAPGASQESGVRRRVKPTTGQVRRETGSEEVGGGESPTPRLARPHAHRAGRAGWQGPASSEAFPGDAGTRARADHCYDSLCPRRRSLLLSSGPAHGAQTPRPASCPAGKAETWSGRGGSQQEGSAQWGPAQPPAEPARPVAAPPWGSSSSSCLRCLGPDQGQLILVII